MPPKVFCQPSPVSIHTFLHPWREVARIFGVGWNPVDNHLLAASLSGQPVHVLVDEGTFHVVHFAHEGVRPVMRHRADKFVLHLRSSPVGLVVILHRAGRNMTSGV